MASSDSMRSLQAQVFAALSADALDQDPERSILLGMQALNATLQHGEPTEFAADQALRQAIWQSRLRLVIRYDGDAVPTCADWNHDGTHIVTGSDNGPVVVWDATTGKPLWSNKFTNAWTIAFSPDRTKIAVGGLLPNVAILDASSGALLKTISVEQAVAVSFSLDGRRLAIQTPKSSGVWDVETARLLMSLGDGTWANLAWSPDGKRIATCANGARLWDADTGTVLQTLGSARDVRCVAWSPDSALLAIALDQSCEIWDTSTGMQRSDIGAFAVGGGIVAWSPDGKRLAKRSGNMVTVYDATDGSLSMTLRGHRHGDPNPFLAWSRDSARLATGAGQTGPMNYAAIRIDHLAEKRGYLSTKIWDMRVDSGSDGVEISTLRLPARIFGAAWSGDGGRIAVACKDASRIFDAESGEELSRFPTQAQNQQMEIAWSPDSAWLVVNEVDAQSARRITRMWCTSSGKELLTLPAADAVSVGSLERMNWSADGARLAASDAKQRVAVWEMRTQRLVSNPDAQIDASVHALSPDGNLLAAASGNAATIRILDVESGRLLKTLSSPDSLAPDGLAWLPDGKRLVTINSASITVWYVPGETVLFTFANPLGYLRFVLSPDRMRLALLAKTGGQTVSGEHDKPGDSPFLSLWDLESGQRLPQPEFLDDYPYSFPPQVQWRPDGQQVATAWRTTTGLFDGSNGPYWGGVERFVRVSYAATGEERFAMNHVPADDIAWRPDGKRMACCYDQRVQIYACDAQDLLALARTRVMRNFTFDECVRYFHGGDPPPIP